MKNSRYREFPVPVRRTLSLNYIVAHQLSQHILSGKDEKAQFKHETMEIRNPLSDNGGLLEEEDIKTRCCLTR